MLCIMYLMILCRKITIHKCNSNILILLSNYLYLAPARKAAAPGASGRACTGSTTARAARRPPRGPGITCTENNIYTEIV